MADKDLITNSTANNSIGKLIDALIVAEKAMSRVSEEEKNPIK